MESQSRKEGQGRRQNPRPLNQTDAGGHGRSEVGGEQHALTTWPLGEPVWLGILIALAEEDRSQAMGWSCIGGTQRAYWKEFSKTKGQRIKESSFSASVWENEALCLRPSFYVSKAAETMHA